MPSQRALTSIAPVAAAALAIALAGCQTAGPAARSAALTKRPAAAQLERKVSQAAQARKANVATRTVVMGVGY